MKTVWKYVLKKPTEIVTMPEGATVLTVGNQYGQITLWAQVDDEAPLTQARVFRIVGTGKQIPEPLVHDTLAYVGTAIGIDRVFVFHVYEEVP